MVDYLEQLDKQVFLLINGWHSDFFDVLMLLISEKFTWVPLYLILLFLIIRKDIKVWWLSVMTIVLLIAIADQVSVHLFKDVFMRYRPCHNANLQHLVHIVNGHCGGKYSFVSSHATNSFAIAGFVMFFMKKTWLSISLLIWAAIVAYSRIYLGVHYPADVFCGGILGILVSWLVFSSYNYLRQRINYFP